MNKTLLTKIIKTINCSNLDISEQYVHYAEIFSNVKYKDYYLRGQVASFLDPLYDINDHALTSIGHYCFFFFVLVNNEYQERLKMLNWESDFGIFVGNTIDEFLEEAKNYYNNITPNYDILMREKSSLILTEPIFKNDKITPVSVKIEDLEIKESPYIKELVEEKKDIILLDMDIILDNIENYEKSIDIESIYPQKIYSFPALNYSDYWECVINNLKDGRGFLYTGYDLDFIKNLYDIVCLKLDYRYLSRKDYLIILRDIGNLAWDWIDKKKITKKYLKQLNAVKPEIEVRTCPFTNFCYKFLDELIADLVTQKQISQCQFYKCGDFFKYKGNKKYCSVLSKYEDKNCQRQAAEHRRYLRKKLENLNK